MLRPDVCPADPETTAEVYLLNRLEPDEVIAFEGHYSQCQRCADALDSAEKHVLAMKGRQLPGYS